MRFVNSANKTHLMRLGRRAERRDLQRAMSKVLKIRRSTMSEEYCLLHGYTMRYDRQSGFYVCRVCDDCQPDPNEVRPILDYDFEEKEKNRIG